MYLYYTLIYDFVKIKIKIKIILDNLPIVAIIGSIYIFKSNKAHTLKMI